MLNESPPSVIESPRPITVSLRPSPSAATAGVTDKKSAGTRQAQNSFFNIVSIPENIVENAAPARRIRRTGAA